MQSEINASLTSPEANIPLKKEVEQDQDKDKALNRKQAEIEKGKQEEIKEHPNLHTSSSLISTALQESHPAPASPRRNEIIELDKWVKINYPFSTKRVDEQLTAELNEFQK